MSRVQNWAVRMRLIVPCSTLSCEAHIPHIVIFTLIKIGRTLPSVVADSVATLARFGKEPLGAWWPKPFVLKCLPRN